MQGERRRVGAKQLFWEALSAFHALRNIGGRYHILANSPAHLEAQFGCDGHVSQIKKTVNVAPE